MAGRRTRTPASNLPRIVRNDSTSAPVLPLAGLSDNLGVVIPDDVLVMALTHRSFAYENGGLPTNERLEFLGDAVLGLVVTDWLYAKHPNLSEGQLAKMRAAVVNMRALADIARLLDVGDYLRLGRGEETTGGRDKSSILADTLEALFGACYLTHGLEVARDLVMRQIGPLVNNVERLGAGLDWKTSLQELAAVRGLGVPEYRLTEEGPDHAKSFQATVWLSGQPYSIGAGRSKKEAEQQAASRTWETLRVDTDPSPLGMTSL